MDPDLALITALRAGHEAALSELMQRHAEGLFRFAVRYLHNEVDAREAVQETFISFYFKSSKFKPQFLVKTWLYAIAANQCRDQLRKRPKRVQTVPVDGPVSEKDAAEIAETGANPAERTSLADRFRILWRAIDKLPHNLRLPLVLCVLEGKNHKEAAAIMQITPKTVELRIYHAKARLRAMLQGKMEI